jgi:hypothetical protein
MEQLVNQMDQLIPALVLLVIMVHIVKVSHQHAQVILVVRVDYAIFELMDHMLAIV